MLKETLLNIVDLNFDKKLNNIGVFGQNITTRALEIYNEFKKNNKITTVFTQNKAEAEELFSIICEFEEETYIYPEIDILKRYTTKSNDLIQNSIKVLENIVTKTPSIIIIPIEAIYRTVKNPKDFKDNSFEINLDTEISFNDLQKKLVNMGYKKVESVDVVGEFSKRGSIVDIFSPLSEKPVRLDFFDDELDSIRLFDESTQKSLKKVDKIEIYPTSDFFLTSEEKDVVVGKLQEKINDKKLKELENYQDINQYLKEKIELYHATGDFSSLESFSNLIYKTPFSIIDYLDENTIIFFDNYHKILEKIEGLREYFLTNLQEINRNYIFQEVIDSHAFEKLQNINTVKYYLSTLKLNEKIIEKNYNLDIRDLAYYSSEEFLAKEIREKLNENYKVLISLNTQKQKDYVEKILFDNYFYDDIYYGIKEGKIFIDINKFRLKGFEDKKNKIFLLTPRELFTKEERKKRRLNFKYTNSEKIRNYQELNVGDYIVHVSHGIGLYEGIENVEVGGVYKDFLKIVYDGGDIIYVDINNMNYIQKYTASTDNRKPALNKLGTKKWQQVKNKVRREIEDISEDLIKLYIKRELSSGYAYSQDGSMQYEFEADFPFVPTDDQLKATEEIKRDMEKERPMDRLLCGDVGFGKTEVAMRIAFKAVMDGKQVAVLVPTTLLAEQHYDNFVNRFENFPINIEVVSRFNTAKDITNICKRLKEGKIDIMIGTHKLLNDKFVYNDLGLLIIDEEQRFGVKHKEKIKHLKNTVDVLTLSATPIPRTMQMSLVGIRDMSILDDPPEERVTIATFVLEYNDSIIREAIYKEIDRGGQVYFVYNRIHDMDKMYVELSRLVPDAKIAMAHSKLSNKELENIMYDFQEGEYDILLCTTIIETGMDIKNCNTMIIYDADKMGLSQLYQLKGRIGRSTRRAYAYFTYEKDKVLTEISEKRLMAIRDFSEFGSGFKIAMRDLELRGAGNILGECQSGHIETIGYEMYVRMLEESIKTVKGENLQIKDQTTIELSVDAYIPSNYIVDNNQKIDMYRKIAAISSRDDFDEIYDELTDRFGNVPTTVLNVMNVSYLKTISTELNFIRIIDREKSVVFKFEQTNRDILQLIGRLSDVLFRKIEFNLNENAELIFNYDKDKLSESIDFVENLLFLKQKN